MNHLPRLLHDIAEQEIPVKEIDMWRKIEPQLPRPTMRRQHTWVYNTIVATVILMILIAIGGGAYAFFQGKKKGDPGIQGARDAGLVQTYEASQTLGDYIVTLDEAYADAQRLVVYFTVNNMSAEANDQQVYMMLTDEDGNNFSMASAYPTVTENGIEFYAEYYMQVFSEDESGNWEEIKDYTQTLEDNTLHMNMMVTIAPPDEEFMGTLLSPFEFDKLLKKGTALDPVTIAFDVPIFQAVVLEPQTTVRVNDVAMVLDRVEVTPAQTVIRVCFDVPDPSEDWQLVSTITLGESEVVSGGWSGFAKRPPDPNNPANRCYDQSFFAFYDANQPTTLVISIDKIEVNDRWESPEYWEPVKAELAKRGIEVNYTFDHAVIREFVSLPDGMTEEEFYEVEKEVQDGLRAYVNGPWVFEIELP